MSATYTEPRPMPRCCTCSDWGTIIDRSTQQEIRCPDRCPASQKVTRTRC